MTTKLPYIGYDKPLTESNSWFTYSERLAHATITFVRLVDSWQVDLMDLACAIHDDPEWQEFMRNGQKLTV
jgi:hypothetical protein